MSSPAARRSHYHHGRRMLAADVATADAIRAERAGRVADAIASRNATMRAQNAAAPRDLDSLQPGDAIRDRYGWHVVVRINRASVAVATGYSWTQRVANESIIETRRRNP